jgi:hypothetical protein
VDPSEYNRRMLENLSRKLNFTSIWFVMFQGANDQTIGVKDHFTHKIESPFPLQSKHSHWWKRRSQSKFASHYAWGTNGVCECKMDIKSTLDDIKWIMSHGHLHYFQKPPLGGRPNTKTRWPCHTECSQPLIYSILSCVRTNMNKHSLN